MSNPVEEFRAALAGRGIIPPRDLLADGELHRCDAKGKRGKGDAAYVLHLDGIPAGGFENWRDGKGWENWRADLGRSLTAQERATNQARAEAAKRQREADKAQRNAEARAKATRIWTEAKPAPADHPYLVAKAVRAHGVRLHGDCLVIPLRESQELQSLQFIAPDGSKRFLTGGQKLGCYHCLGRPGEAICIVEGYATGASVHEATGHAVAVALDAGNLLAVAQSLRQKFSDARLIFCADDDYRTKGNPGIAKANEAARTVGALLAVPDFGASRPEGAKDFNDMAACRGADAVRACIAAASIVPAQATNSVEIVRADMIAPEPIRWLWPGWLACGKFHLIAGAPGTGKTTIGIAFSAVITSGGVFPDGSRAPVGSVLIWSGEDDYQDSILPRFIANGGDTKRLKFVTGRKDEGGKSQPFDPATDFPALVEAAREIIDLQLLMIDPVVSAVSGDSNKNAEVRRALQPLANFALEIGAAVLGISHFSKGTSGHDPVERVTGSIAFAAMARVVMATAKPIEQGGAKRLVRSKSNIGPDGGGFEYGLHQVCIDDKLGIDGQAVDWGQHLEGTARDLLAEVESPNDEADAPARLDCERWLKGLLSDGPFDAKEIRRLAEVTGRKWRTVNRAKNVLGIKSIKTAMSGGWFWELSKATEECRTRSVASFGKTDGFAEECHANGVAPFGQAGTVRDGEVEVEI